jgi:hypothetical protein
LQRDTRNTLPKMDSQGPTACEGLLAMTPYRIPCPPDVASRPRLRRFRVVRGPRAQSLLLTVTVYATLAMMVAQVGILQMAMRFRMPSGCACIVTPTPEERAEAWEYQKTLNTLHVW